jgi:hypothetical protein
MDSGMKWISATLQILIRHRALLGIGGISAFILYGAYTLILRTGLLTPLTPEGSFGILSGIVKYTFVFAVTAVVLSIMAYTLPRIVPSLSFQLTPDASASLVTRVVNNLFALGGVAVVFASISYVLPRILPPSVFDPVPRVEYGVAISEMYDPFRASRLATTLDKTELYPGFPYFSRESDHPSAWPPRVSRDRHTLFESYLDVLTRYDSEIQAAKIPKNMQLFGISDREGKRTQIETLVNMRSWYYSDMGENSRALARVLGPDAARAFLKVEKARSELRNDFPNRFALLRIKNTGKVDARDITVELDINGALYDHTISADVEHTRGAAYDRAGRRIVIERMLPGYVVELRFWYRYLPVSARVFPDEKDIILDVTQGVVINNIAASGGRAIYNRSMVEDVRAYKLLYAGSARKENFDEDFRVYDQRRAAENRERAKKQEQDHPSLRNVSVETLAASQRPDDSVNAIWVSFDSMTGKSYKAIHVFKHPSGPYILLSSKDKDEADFIKVRSDLEQAYRGAAESDISDRGDDITSVIRVSSGFSQKAIAARVKDWFEPKYKKVVIEAVHY